MTPFIISYCWLVRPAKDLSKTQYFGWLCVCATMQTRRATLIMVLSVPQPPLTSYCSQRIQAVPSPCCCRWSFPSTRGRCCRFHDFHCRGFHCRVIRSHSRLIRYSSSPHPPQVVTESERSCDGCLVKREGPDRCCRCPQKGGPGQAYLGWRHPYGAAVPWSCTLGPPLG